MYRFVAMAALLSVSPISLAGPIGVPSALDTGFGHAASTLQEGSAPYDVSTFMAQWTPKSGIGSNALKTLSPSSWTSEGLRYPVSSISNMPTATPLTTNLCTTTGSRSSTVEGAYVAEHYSRETPPTMHSPFLQVAIFMKHKVPQK